jgi:hypothetical protein
MPFLISSKEKRVRYLKMVSIMFSKIISINKIISKIFTVLIHQLINPFKVSKIQKSIIKKLLMSYFLIIRNIKIEEINST